MKQERKRKGKYVCEEDESDIKRIGEGTEGEGGKGALGGGTDRWKGET